MLQTKRTIDTAGNPLGRTLIPFKKISITIIAQLEPSHAVNSR